MASSSSPVIPPIMVKNPPRDIATESSLMLSFVATAYNFAQLLSAWRDGHVVDLEVPDDFPLTNEQFQRFKQDSCDFRSIDGDGDGVGDGLSFTNIAKLVVANKDEMDKVSFHDPEWDHDFVNKVNAEEDKRGVEFDPDKYFMATYRSLHNKVSCVYTVIKDLQEKRIIVSFRGSRPPGENRDWEINLNAICAELRTPKQIRSKMDGLLKERVLVHTGFYDYLFDNDEITKGAQRYDKILGDIKPLMEPGFSIYVTGHSLGGALATMFSFKLAGESKDWIPRPITCITYAAPYSGSAGYRKAYEQLEQDGLIRHLRINNASDAVPSLPPMSIPTLRKPFRPYKHVGINLRLKDNGCKIEHSSYAGFWTTLQNNFLGPILDAIVCLITGKSATYYHGTLLHGQRVKASWDELSGKTIDDLYKDKEVVSDIFVKDSCFAKTAGEGQP